MTGRGSKILLAETTFAQVRAELARGRSTVVVPFGALEQHGPHLPLDTDAVLADRLGPLLAERLDALCAPTMRIGCSQHHLAFAGTLSLRPETLGTIVHDLVDSLARHGFRRAVLPRHPRGASSDAGHAYVTAFLDAIERQIDDGAEDDRMS